MLEQNLVKKVVRGFNLEPGSTVALNVWGEDERLLQNLKDVLEANGHTLTVHQINLDTLKAMAEKNALSHNPKTLKAIKDAHASIDLFFHPPMLPKGFPRDKIDAFKGYLSELFRAMAHGKHHFIQWRIPTKANAEARGIDPEVFKDAYLNAYSVDLDQMKKRADTIHEKLKDTKTIRIESKHASLSFELEDRVWHRDLGDGDIPFGEIAIAPVETSAEGTLFVDKTTFAHETFENLTLTFKNGKAVSDHPGFEKALVSFQGDKTIIGEFGIGLNDAITTRIGDTLHDEKIFHTIHIALGANAMFGGINKSNLHHDFVIRPECIYADDMVIYDQGKWTIL